jgi:TPR repeat protein
MGAWSALFLVLLTSGSVDAPHPGASIEFWKKAYAEGKYDAGPRLLKLLGSQAEQGSASAQNDLGVLYLEGKAVEEDHGAAAHWFSLACAGGDLEGCANVANQFLFLREARSDEDVARALARLEQAASAGASAKACYLVGFAYETGRGRPQDLERARRCYEEACRLGHPEACKALERMRVAAKR